MINEKEKFAPLEFVEFFGKIILREIWNKMTLEQKKELIPECD